MSQNCIALSTIDSQLSCQEQDNMGGLVPQLIFGYHDDVASWPDWPAPAANSATALSLDQAGVIAGDLVMAAGASAYKMDFTEEQGSFSIAPQGDPGAISFLYTLNIINRRIRKKLLGFMNAAKNRKMFFLVQDANGVWYLMGDKARGARLSSGDGATTGQASTDSNQVALTFTYTSPRALAYEGDTEDLLTASSSNSTQH